MQLFVDSPHRGQSTPILFVTESNWPALRQGLDAGARTFADAAGFEPKPGRHLLLPGGATGIAAVLFGIGRADAPDRDPFEPGRLPGLLPAGAYRFGNEPPQPRLAALGFALGCYRFSRYRKAESKAVTLELPAGLDRSDLTRIVEGVTLARDLINTPANDLGPVELEEAARALASRHGGQFHSIVGPELLAQNLPLIHAVGRASSSAPRLIDIRWGEPTAPKVTLVGKGVCFDTGGYNLKPTSGMATMKKDMGGAAVVLGLAQMVMAAKLKLRLRVLIPAVENSVSGSAYRPSDVFKSRKGLTVEIGNTDAEGRLVLADALADADAEKPELLIDCATLTGAARMATGMELPPFFTDDEKLAADISRIAMAVADPVWRLPLWRGYEPTLNSPIADLTNNPSYNLAGAITAALFLNRFVEATKSWLHIDIPGWVDRPRPGRRLGAEANGARLLYALLQERYGR